MLKDKWTLLFRILIILPLVGIVAMLLLVRKSPAPKTNKTQIKTKNKKVKIIVYSDVQCPYCARYHKTLRKVLPEYNGLVDFEFRHFPLKMHPYSQAGAEASECAREQGVFLEYLDKLFANQAKINNSYFVKVAEELNLDMDKFKQCIHNHKYKEKVDKDMAGGNKAGVRGTPASVINGKLIPGALPEKNLKQIIENNL